MTLQDLQQMTLLELLEVCDTDPQHIATGRDVTVNPWTIGDDVVFGSPEWFKSLPEVQF